MEISSLIERTVDASICKKCCMICNAYFWPFDREYQRIFFFWHRFRVQWNRSTMYWPDRSQGSAVSATSFEMPSSAREHCFHCNDHYHHYYSFELLSISESIIILMIIHFLSLSSSHWKTFEFQRASFISSSNPHCSLILKSIWDQNKGKGKYYLMKAREWLTSLEQNQHRGQMF